jgi:hypothetical protein
MGKYQMSFFVWEFDVVNNRKRPSFDQSVAVFGPEDLYNTSLRVNGILSNQERGGFTVMPNGKQFVVLLPTLKKPEKAFADQINVIINWFEELKQRFRYTRSVLVTKCFQNSKF